MTDLSTFPITAKWPPQHPDRLQYYGLPTPNGVKVSIMLEECGLPYDAQTVDFAANEQTSEAFLSLNPNGKIPAILDPDGPDGAPLALFESGAILIYLAEKTGKLLPVDPAERYRALQWLMFQMGNVGPMFGQLGFFVKFAGKGWQDKRPRDRYAEESSRLLEVMDAALSGREWFVNEYSIADIAMIGVVRNLITFYGAREIVGFDDFAHVAAWLDRAMARPAVRRGLEIPAR